MGGLGPSILAWAAAAGEPCGQVCRANGAGSCQAAGAGCCQAASSAQRAQQAPQQWHEWDEEPRSSAAAGDDDEPCSGLGPLFSAEHQSSDEELVEERVCLPNLAGPLLVRTVSRSHRHTLAHTGLMLWESAPVLARALLQPPALLAGAHRPEAAVIL